MINRVLLACLIAFAFLAGAFYFTASSARDRALAESDRALAARAQFHAEQVDRVLQQRMVQTFTFAALPSMRGLAASDVSTRPARMAIANSELQSIVSADPNIRAAAIVDLSGRVILTTDVSMNADWSTRLFVREALAGQLHASPTVYEFNEYSQYYSSPILNNLGDVAGVFILRVVAQEMWAALGSQPDVMLVDENGVRIADRSTKSQLLIALAPMPADAAVRVLVEKRYGAKVTQINATTLTDLANAVKRDKPGQVVYRDASGQTFHAATYRLKTNPWMMIAFASEDTLLASANDAIIDQIKIALTTAAIIVGLVFAIQSFARSRETAA